MAIRKGPVLFLVLSISCVLHSTAQAVKSAYIVYLGAHPHGYEPTVLDVNKRTEYHYELLATYMTSKEKAKEAIIYSYTHSINGFAAILEEEAAAKISEHPEVVSVFPSQENELHTTRSWQFLGLESRNGKISADSLWTKGRFGEDVIIGNLDTGVWPESESFSDEGMGPIPSRWKGYCETEDGVKCNRKLIGARYFKKGYEASLGRPLNGTARDTNGHGTHTLSTAAGRFVPGANLLGSANGTAKGGSPMARAASYKVCWGGCVDADVLAGFDAAIQDGVDILSVSIGSGRQRRNYFSSAVSVGSFHAVRKGILVVGSAGNAANEGGYSNVAPWIFTVAASTIDREFSSDAILGNGKQLQGLSFNTNTLPVSKNHPLVYAPDVKTNNASANEALGCSPGSLDPAKVKGKIVTCRQIGLSSADVEMSLVVSQAGGIGMIGLRGEYIYQLIRANPYYIPTSSLLTEAESLSILVYLNSTKSPKAFIRGATEIGQNVAPMVASFSSIGPNRITREILKPDITAPGVQILAAFTEAMGPSSVPTDKRKVPFNIISGTSMSCPHIAGVAGLLKTMHPDWSPAAIRSAMMTTAQTTSNAGGPILDEETLRPANPYFYGSGHVSPNIAMDPGLVYDTTITDYYTFLCSMGYNATILSRFTNESSFRCPQANTSLWDLNYPTISVTNLSLTGSTTVTRTLKNVGTPGKYTVHIEPPKEVAVSVEPNTLEFKSRNEEKKFKITLGAKEEVSTGQTVFGAIVWSDGKHQVRSTIAASNYTNFESD
ncbi:hypothetical protein K2173_009059 [Erythroxylum novogranatense]|uniref:Subtilisin-like protease SBT5.3 n=1 Tax=Erythroxylum novogranatense TaxID=1862640 RepID=A0AAV8TSN7_9ROSI|nr:hypothetical protein K2173_009059 [Erythroxylum novogranatense]